MKRPSKLIVGMVALLIGTMTAGTAFAWGRSHVFVGFNFGFPGYWGAPYYAPYPYYPAPAYYPVAVAPAAPPVYVVRGEPDAQQLGMRRCHWRARRGGHRRQRDFGGGRRRPGRRRRRDRRHRRRSAERSHSAGPLRHRLSAMHVRQGPPDPDGCEPL